MGLRCGGGGEGRGDGPRLAPFRLGRARGGGRRLGGSSPACGGASPLRQREGERMRTSGGCWAPVFRNFAPKAAGAARARPLHVRLRVRGSCSVKCVCVVSARAPHCVFICLYKHVKPQLREPRTIGDRGANGYTQYGASPTYCTASLASHPGSKVYGIKDRPQTREQERSN